MTRRFLRTVARLLIGAVFATQWAVAAYACPALSNGAMAQSVVVDGGGQGAVQPGMVMDAAVDCDDMVASMDPAAPNLCAEHCKQGQQSDRASFGIVVPPVLLNALYETPSVREPVHEPPQAGAWLSALVAASPPHAIAHCVLRI